MFAGIHISDRKVAQGNPKHFRFSFNYYNVLGKLKSKFKHSLNSNVRVFHVIVREAVTKSTHSFSVLAVGSNVARETVHHVISTTISPIRNYGSVVQMLHPCQRSLTLSNQFGYKLGTNDNESNALASKLSEQGFSRLVKFNA